MNLITLVVPCYNEIESLPTLIKKINGADDKINFLILDNGSTDGTKDYLYRIKQDLNKNVELYFIEKNEGYGHGVYSGLKVCNTKYIGWIHGDLQFDFDNLKKVTNFLLEKNTLDTKIFYKGVRTGRSAIDKFFSFFMGIIASLILGTKFYEINAQPTIFHRCLLNDIKNPPLDFNFDTYIYWLAIIKSFDIERDYFLFPPRKYGISKWDIGLVSKLKFSLSLIKYFFELKSNKDI